MILLKTSSSTEDPENLLRFAFLHSEIHLMKNFIRFDSFCAKFFQNANFFLFAIYIIYILYIIFFILYYFILLF